MRLDTADIKKAASYAEQIRQAAEMLKQMPHDDPVYDAVVDFLQGNPQALLREMHRLQTEEEAVRRPGTILQPILKSARQQRVPSLPMNRVPEISVQKQQKQKRKKLRNLVRNCFLP